MSWLQILLDTDAQTVEQISDGLMAIGAISVTLQDAEDKPLYQPPLNTTPLWRRTRIIGLFEGDTNSTQLQTQLQTILVPLPPYQIQTLEDQDWSRVWMTDFHPMQFGERIWICPSWQTPPDPKAINIQLDPGLAFGSGTHATTALCLEWLAEQTDLSDKTLIDYGCGSGILSITAIKLGAKHVWAVDHDSQALEATKDNAKKNEIDTAISGVLPKQLPDFKADSILANILATPLIELAPTLIAHLKKDAVLVLSGILKEQSDEVIAAYTPYLTITEIKEHDEWIRIVAQKF
ncbi:50S ribosomal protein L11 methyltransferase [Candidatus Parabeggiatoa sp. HSG14]|uniref:50S ribosomal protein L11 methyltransferase n=1 Tax=Candidatus Parabeggiatoa sp. HSG14 TaxID=3055593 RepID=UPI0025A7F2B8|nr:50S ribosomal protein L11 methyltransferase [Thiotrichales bacterium HSG14]